MIIGIRHFVFRDLFLFSVTFSFLARFIFIFRDLLFFRSNPLYFLRLNCELIDLCPVTYFAYFYFPDLFFTFQSYFGHSVSYFTPPKMCILSGTCLVSHHISMVSCQKGPIRHAYAWQIGPSWQETLDL